MASIQRPFTCFSGRRGRRLDASHLCLFCRSLGGCKTAGKWTNLSHFLLVTIPYQMKEGASLDKTIEDGSTIREVLEEHDKAILPLLLGDN